MQALDVFCLPSYANEGVPQALMQAMACGLPVVTTPVGSIEEIVADGVTGVLVPPEDPARLRAGLAALLADPALSRCAGTAPRAPSRSSASARTAWSTACSKSSARWPAMGERFNTRATVVTHALARSIARKAGGGPVRRVLVAHNLLLGDTLMLTPLLAKLRAAHPAAEIELTAAPAFVPLYAGRPYGVRALAFTPSRAATTRALLGREPYDLAFVLGDNRYSWLAAALGARHIVAHAGGPARSNWFVDEAQPYASAPAAWGDMVAGARSKAPSRHPTHAAIGPLRPPRLSGCQPGLTRCCTWVRARRSSTGCRSAGMRSRAPSPPKGSQVAWSAGRGEEAVVQACDPAGEFASYAGRLDLAQLWHLLDSAALLVAPDTGVAHLGRAAWTPTVSLVGPGSPMLSGTGRFWRDTPWHQRRRGPVPVPRPGAFSSAAKSPGCDAAAARSPNAPSRAACTRSPSMRCLRRREKCAR